MRGLLVLDLDETLVHSVESPLDRAPDFETGPYLVYRRPHLTGFLEAVAHDFALGVWSAGSAAYVAGIVRGIVPPGVPLEFVWDRRRVTLRVDPETREEYVEKRLRKVKRRGYPLARTLVVDNEPRTAAANYGNVVVVRSYLGQTEDDELPLLARYLSTLRDAPDVRTVEKRGWRARAGIMGP